MDHYPPPAQILGILMNSIFLDMLDEDAKRLDRLNRMLVRLPPEQRDGFRPIRLLVAVDRDGRVLGVRVTAHQETPGLGDDIEAGRSDWITRFDGRGLGDPPADQWAVRRDGGRFDQFDERPPV